MGRTRLRIYPQLLKTLDTLLMVLAFGLASLVVLYQASDMPMGEFFAIRVKLQNFLLFFFILLIWRIILSISCHYELDRMTTWQGEAADAIRATSICTAVLGLAAIVFNLRLVNPLFMMTFWVASSVVVAGNRIGIVWLLSRPRQQDLDAQDVLMVGTNARTVEFARKLESKPDINFRIIGFVDDGWPGLKAFRRSPYRVVCDFNGVADFIRNNVVDKVIVGLPMKSLYLTASRITELCESQGIVVHFIPAIVDSKFARFETYEFDGQPLVTLHSGPRDDFALLIKRVMDFTVSLVVLIALFPVLLAVGLLIKLTSAGPAIFSQERLGLNKRRFRLYKFRTMVPDAEQKQHEIEKLNEVTGPVFKIKNDPRVTPLGRFLRRTSIDELPQFLNVLKGEMSLVGPRPLPFRDYQGFHTDWHRRRFSVKPGITCFWQMSGRNSIPFEKWMELDMQYIDRWSLWLDIEIMVGTIPAVLKGSGAA